MSYLGQPVAVEDRPVESLILVNVGEVFQSDHVNVFVRPSSLLITDQPEKVKEAKLMSRSCFFYFFFIF